MPDHKLSDNAIRAKILLFGQVLEIMKSFKRWIVKDLLELSSDAMKYVIIKDRLLEALRMKWQDTKMSKMKYNIANANHQW